MNDPTKTLEDEIPIGLIVERNWFSQSGNQLYPTEYCLLLSVSNNPFDPCSFVVFELITQRRLFPFSESIFFRNELGREVYQPTFIWPDGWESKQKQELFLYKMKSKLLGSF
jgi:hypothetical protein